MGRLAVYKRIHERDLFVCLKLYEGNVVIIFEAPQRSRQITRLGGHAHAKKCPTVDQYCFNPSSVKTESLQINILYNSYTESFSIRVIVVELSSISVYQRVQRWPRCRCLLQSMANTSSFIYFIPHH